MEADKQELLDLAIRLNVLRISSEVPMTSRQACETIKALEPIMESSRFPESMWHLLK